MSDRDPPASGAGLALTIWTAALAALVATTMMASAAIAPWTGYLVNAGLAALLGGAVLWPRRRLLVSDRLLRWGLMVYFGAGFALIPFSLMPWSSLRWFLLHLGGLLLFLAVSALPVQRRSAVYGAMLAAGFMTAAFALRQRFGGFEQTLALMDDLPDYAFDRLREGRVFGLTFSPDMLAAMMAGLMPVAVAGLVAGARDQGHGRDLGLCLVFGVLLALFCAALFYTKSVGGALAAGAGVAVWLALTYGFNGAGKGAGKWRLLMVMAALLAVVVSLWFMKARGGHVVDFDDPHNPVARRLDNWVTGARVFAEFPATGAGGGQYGLAMKLRRSLDGNEAKHVHNTLIEVLAETGPLGLAGLVMIMAGFVGAGLRQARSREDEDAIAPSAGRDWAEFERLLRPGVIAGGAAVALHSLIDFDWAVPEVAAIFWVALAASTPGTPREDEPGRSSRPLIRLSVVAALLVSTLACLYQMEGSLRLGRAVVAARAGEWTSARRLSARALAWDRSNDEAYSLHARSLMERSSINEATHSLRRAISLNRRYPYHYRDLGLALMARDFEAAGEAFARAVELYPNSLGLNVHHGRWLVRANRPTPAEAAFLHAARCHYINWEPLRELGRLKMESGRTDEAESYFRQAAESPYAPERAALDYARFLVEQGRTGEAVRFLKSWLETHPDAPGVKDALLLLGPGGGPSP